MEIYYFKINPSLGKIAIHVVAYIAVLFFAYINFFTGNQLTLKALFLLLLYIYVSNKYTRKVHCYVLTVVIALEWSMIDLFVDNYFFSVTYFINLFLRIISLTLITYLIYSYKIQKDKLNATIKKLEITNQEKNDYVGMAAHDLRSPINSIYSYTDLLLDAKNTNLSEKQVSHINKIRTLSSKMITLLTETLDYTKIESGTVELHIQPFDYLATINEIVDEMHAFAKKKNITIEFDIQERKIALNFDRNRIEQVFINLISNAIKYSKPNTKVIIRVRKADNYVITDIIDQGIGIKEKEIEHIFKPFVKTSSLPTAGEDSVGLGLAIVKKLVEAHNGKIYVTSKPNVGSTFSFALPC
jgi:signal transduction histidine kinase